VETEAREEHSTDSSSKPAPQAITGEQVEAMGRQFLDTGAQQARRLLRDLREMNFKDEVLPIDANNLPALLKDFVFWAVALLGVVPLLIVTVGGTNTQLALFALFFALVWGVIFKLFVLEDAISWKWLMASLFFTGIVGIWLLLFIYRIFLPGVYLGLADSENLVVSLEDV
jgi:hypothetical protein